MFRSRSFQRFSGWRGAARLKRAKKNHLLPHLFAALRDARGYLSADIDGSLLRRETVVLVGRGWGGGGGNELELVEEEGEPEEEEEAEAEEEEEMAAAWGSEALLSSLPPSLTPSFQAHCLLSESL